MYHAVYGLFLLLGLALPVFISTEFLLQELSIALSFCFLFRKYRAVRAGLWFLAGLSCSSWRLDYLLDKQLPISLDRQTLVARFVVVKVPEREESGVRFEAKLLALARRNDDKCNECSNMLGSRVRLYHRLPDVAYRLGHTYEGEVRLKRPRGFVNPGGFDYQAWLLSQQVFATGYVKAAYSLNTHAPGVFSRFNASMRERLSQDAHHMNGVVQALLLGERSGISQHQWDVFRATGTSHLIAISGLHVGLLAFYVFVLTRLIFRFVSVHSWFALRAIPAVTAALVSGFYVLLSGASVPSQRAWCLSVLVMIAWVWGRRLNPLVVLIYSAVVVVAFNPLALTQNSFYLSFSAVAVLMSIFCFRPVERRPIKTLLLAQGALTVALSVVQATLGMPVSVSSVFANCLAVPLVSLVGLPVLFLSAVSGWFSNAAGALLLEIARGVFSGLWWFLESLAQFSGPHWLPMPAGFISVVSMMGVLVMLAPSPMRLRPLGLLILLSGVLTEHRAENDYRLTVLDVGQGLSVVFETPAEVLVYDVGARFSDKFDIGSGVLAPYLRYRGIRKVDTLFISHGDNDHAGGEAGLRANIPVGSTFSNHTSSDEHLRHPCVFGAEPEVSTYVDIEVLWPEPGDVSGQSNYMSCVVVLRFAGKTLLLPGDIDRAAELRLVASGRLPTDVDILLAPHHGSISSSSYPFLKTVNAEHIVVSAGYKNSYGHPSNKVLPRYDALDAKVWRTDQQGAVIFEWKGGEVVSSVSARQLNKKRWFDTSEID